MLELILVSFSRYSASETSAGPFISIYSYCYYSANDNNNIIVLVNIILLLLYCCYYYITLTKVQLSLIMCAYWSVYCFMSAGVIYPSGGSIKPDPDSSGTPAWFSLCSHLVILNQVLETTVNKKLTRQIMKRLHTMMSPAKGCWRLDSGSDSALFTH